MINSIFSRTNLNSIEILISKALTDSHIAHGDIVLTNDLLKEYVEIKEEIKI